MAIHFLPKSWYKNSNAGVVLIDISVATMQKSNGVLTMMS
jgi:hypothetical protein